MRRALALVLLLPALAIPATASAGGYATAGLAPPPAQLGAGDRWDARVTILQHGVTPMTGQRVSVVTRGPEGKQSFPARETGEPGVYRAAVVIPAGTWRYAAVDPFGVEHGFPPVAARDAATAPAGSSPWPAILLALAAVALLAALGRVAVRRSLAAPAA